MFIYSMRASSIKFFGIVFAAVAALAILLAVFPGSDAAEASAEGIENINYENIKTESARSDFLLSLGYTAESQCVEQRTVKIPEEFDKTMTAYNELQKETGLDLLKYRGKEVELFTYEITNYPGYDGRVMANLLIYRGRVIGGDITTTDIGGFMHGLRPAERSEQS